MPESWRTVLVTGLQTPRWYVSLQVTQIYLLLYIWYSMGLRSSTYNNIFSFPKQASPVQFFLIQSLRPSSSLFPLYKTTKTGFQTRKNFKQQKRWQWQNPDNIHVQQIIFRVQREKLMGRLLARSMKFDLHWISPRWFYIFIWSVMRYSIISKSRLGS